LTQPGIYLALDAPDRLGVFELARRVASVDGDFGFKLNLDVLLLEGGVDLVRAFDAEFGRPIFTDVKMWNGSRTMVEVAVGLARAGPALVNVYAQGGQTFLTRVRDAVGERAPNTDVYGLGVLTHYTDEDCRQLYGVSLTDAVVMFAERAAEAGLPGYIQPGPLLDATAHLPLARLVPGVRPQRFEDRRGVYQAQTITPEQARLGHADTIVVGSGIFATPEPGQALQDLLGSFGRTP
jgi:orotidine-5'-phosphate decarboxylase